MLDACKKPASQERVESRAPEVEFKIRHTIHLIFKSMNEVNAIFCEGRAVAFGKNGGGWSKIFNARWIFRIALVGIGENSKDVWPVFSQNLLELSVSVDLLRSVVFVEVVAPSPFVDWRGSGYRPYHAIECVRAEAVRVVQKHHQFKYDLFMVSEVDEGALRELSRYVCGVDAVFFSRMIYFRSEELCVSRSTVVDIFEKLERPPRSYYVLTCFAQVLR